jgi:transposase InsO family protein
MGILSGAAPLMVDVRQTGGGPWTFSQRVRSAGLAHSLGSIGDAFDNAMGESFWNTQKWRTRMQLSSEIFDWIEVLSRPDQEALSRVQAGPPGPSRRDRSEAEGLDADGLRPHNHGTCPPAPLAALLGPLP